jgi:predicted nucleic acid-binding protein
MSLEVQKYCLDANVLIQAWQKYYSPKLCPGYWEILNDFGKAGRIFLPQNVYEEIVRTEDKLTDWLKNSNVPIFDVDGEVADCLRDIYAANPVHQYLVDNTKQRSLADPWVIAHAIKEKACVVTKEEKVTTPNTTRIKIPNVCDNMNVRWVNDFQFIEELNIQFSCKVLDK